MEGYENNVNLNMLDEDTILIDEDTGERRLKERAEGLRYKIEKCKTCNYNNRCFGIFNRCKI